LLALVERTVAGLGFDLVELERAGHGLLRVTLDTAGGNSRISIEDCERVSRHLTHLFAVENVDYDRLEVSSPGVDRPLRKPADFVRFAGSPVRLQLSTAVDGRRKLRGILLASGGPPGQEWIRVQESQPEDDAVGGRTMRRGRAQPRGQTPAPMAERQLRLADIERARLVPVLDFGSKARRQRPNRAESPGALK
jgi:ribosome maturation factor RimP